MRKLRAQGVKGWVFDSPTQTVPLAAFRKRCVMENISGVYFEGGAYLTGEFLHQRQFDYLFMYRAPILLADEKAKPAFSGLRTEKLENAIRLKGMRVECFGDDILQRGQLDYPGRMQVDETLYSIA